MLNELLANPKFTLIPCTLRSFEQTNRIEFITHKQTPILVCDNGYSIYKKGVLDKEWDDRMKTLLDNYPNTEIYFLLKEYIERNNLPIQQLKTNRGVFYTLIFHTVNEAACYASCIEALVPTEIYTFMLQGRKLYIIPKFLDKSLALHYLKKKFPLERVITAGDSRVDERLVRAGDIGVLPKHSSLNIPSAYRTKSSGILAGEELLEFVYECS